MYLNELATHGALAPNDVKDAEASNTVKNADDMAEKIFFTDDYFEMSHRQHDDGCVHGAPALLSKQRRAVYDWMDAYNPRPSRWARSRKCDRTVLSRLRGVLGSMRGAPQARARANALARERRLRDDVDWFDDTTRPRAPQHESCAEGEEASRSDGHGQGTDATVAPPRRERSAVLYTFPVLRADED